MSGEPRAIHITLLGREFKVACAAEEEARLRASVDYLNRRLEEVRQAGKVVGGERIALLAALNITHEFLSGAAAKAFDLQDAERRIRSMVASVDELLAQQDRLF